MYRHILIATDGSKPSNKAVTHGVKLAKATGARVTILTVTEMLSALAMAGGLETAIALPLEEYQESADLSAAKTLAAAGRIAARAGVACKTEHVSDRRPSEAIVDLAQKRKCDLVVMGSHGRRGIDRLLLGSQTSEVLSRSTRPILVVR